MAIFRVHPDDNVAVAIDPIHAGEQVEIGDTQLTARNDIEKGHKIALVDVACGSTIIKYGFPIGLATTQIMAGDWIHTHNVSTGLGEILAYEYHPSLKSLPPAPPGTFQGYRRKDGRVGIRNEIWIIPTVSCVNRNAELIARESEQMFNKDRCSVEGVYAANHPYGCSQMGDDQSATQRILADLVNHPNAAAVLVLGLGCENNHIEVFKGFLGEYDPSRVKFLEAQTVKDEIAEGVNLIKELAEFAGNFRRESCPVSELAVGLKCGGSDGFSGITGNPLTGAFSDRLIAMGGTTVLTEVPEMFGAETILMNRAANEEVFQKTVRLINDFKEYYLAHNQIIYDNPSPGNKKGGISTLEEKSLGCTQKGGSSNVVDVLPYGEVVTQKGLNLLSGPGNDAIATTVLAAAGCQLILFTTGRGTPLGTIVPSLKIATNTDLFVKKSNWMDFDAGRLLAGRTMESISDELFALVLEVASGKQTKSEVMGFREVSIFKNGVTL